MSTQPYPSTTKKKLTAAQAEAALRLADGATIAATAKKVGVSEKTIDNWKHKPEFLAAIVAAEDAIYQDALGLLKRTTKAAIMTLLACLDPKVSDYVRVGAASKLLDASMEIHSIKELETRIVELEEQLGMKVR